MSFPSNAACRTCKIRRIKCDEAKPVCKRCIKSQRVCINASAPFIIHSENSYANGEVKRPRGPRSSIFQPHPDIQTRAYFYYLHCHFQAPTDQPNIGGGLSECVAMWNMSGRSCPMVSLAFSSTALATYSRAKHHTPAAKEAFTTYCHLLREAQKGIALMRTSKFNARDIDAWLLVISLMGRYEETTCPIGFSASNKAFASLKSWSHHDGAIAILKMWYDDLNHEPATTIVKYARRGLMRSLLIRDLSIPEWMSDGQRFGEHGRELGFDRIFVRIVDLQHQSMVLQSKNKMENAELDALEAKAMNIDNALEVWARRLPSAWSHQRHILPSFDNFPKEHFFSSTVYSYAEHGYATVWSQYFATRMFINNTRLKLLRMHILPKPQKIEDCISQMRDLADSIAASIPFTLGKCKLVNNKLALNAEEETKPYLASTLGWQLTIASIVEGIDENQQSWFRSELANVGKVVGVGLLQKC